MDARLNNSDGGPRVAQAGFTYLAVLFAVALASIALLAVSEVWTTTAQRQAARQIDWVGEQYVNAIGSYYYASPNHVKSFPKRLDDLLEDKRSIVVRRHLRQVYRSSLPDGKQSWDVIMAPDGGIQGIAVEYEGGAGKVSKRYLFVPSRL